MATHNGVRLAAFAPAAYDQLPDLGLYMDQVTTYLQRQCAGLYPEGEPAMTPGMVNNYVKCRLVTRPDGKKYGRDQIAQLMMLCTLKQSATIEEMRRMLDPGEGGTVEAVYRAFCDTQRAVFAAAVRDAATETPMACAVRSAAYRFICMEKMTALAARTDAADESEDGETNSEG